MLDTPEAYAKEAVEYKQKGFNAYKLHPPGKYDFDLEAHKITRDAVGNDFKLMVEISKNGHSMSCLNIFEVLLCFYVLSDRNKALAPNRSNKFLKR